MHDRGSVLVVRRNLVCIPNNIRARRRNRSRFRRKRLVVLARHWRDKAIPAFGNGFDIKRLVGGWPSASRSFMTAVFRPWSKSTNVSEDQSARCKSSRVTSSPACSSKKTRMRKDCSRTLMGAPLRRSSLLRASTSKMPKRQDCVVFVRFSTNAAPVRVPLPGV